MKKRILTCLLAFLILCGTALVPGHRGMAEPAGTGQTKAYPSLDQVDGMRFAVQTGTISGQTIAKRYPNAEVNYFESQTDSLAALKAGKVDLWSSDEPVVRFMQIENPELRILDGYLAGPLRSVQRFCGQPVG